MKYIIISLILLISTSKVHACWYPTYSPGEYYVFYTFPSNDSLPEESASTDKNIMEWQKYSSGQSKYDDIKQVIYDYPLEYIEKIGDKSFNRQDTLYKNTFVKYLVDRKDKEAIRYLILAKKCEMYRAMRNDDWWYPSKEDLKNGDLHEILNEALAYKGKKFKIRYCLQAIRAAYTMEENDLCLQIWDDYVAKQPVSAVRDLCEDYIGGVYLRKGDYDMAIRHYVNITESSSSLWWCINNLETIKSDVDRIKMLNKYYPKSPQLPMMIQAICREAEDKANAKVFDGVDSSSVCFAYEDCGYPFYLKNRQRYLELRDFALQVASEETGDNQAMWQYTASFLTLIDGNAPLAGKYLADAAKMNGSPFIKNNIRILQIMVEAMTGSYDTAFEAYILPELQWLDKALRDHVTDGAKKEYQAWEWNVFANMSSYYFNDMMRKITLSVMAPKYLKQGDVVKALMLTGMASERMRSVTNYRENSEDYSERRNIDFYTDIFVAMEDLSPEAIIKYRDALQKGGDSEFENFLAIRCYKNADYLNEIIGTKYMRLEQFDLAVKYLEKVSPKYDTTLNVYEYFWHDPLSEPYLGRRFIDPESGYKLRFAKKMLVLQQQMRTEKSVKVRAEATYRYALGLLRATSDCWALLSYMNGNVYLPAYLNDSWQNKVLDHCDALLDEALRLSPDREIRAKCLAAYAWNSGDDSWNYGEDAAGNWSKIVNPTSVFVKMYRMLGSKKYASTNISELLFSECDTFLSYQKGKQFLFSSLDVTFFATSRRNIRFYCRGNASVSITSDSAIIRSLESL